MPDASVLIMLVSVDAPDLMLTVPVVLRVPIAASDDETDGAGVSVGVVSLEPRVKKSDLIKPVTPFTLTLDQPVGSCSVTSTLVPAATVATISEFVDAEALTLTASVVRNVAVLLSSSGTVRKSDLI